MNKTLTLLTLLLLSIFSSYAQAPFPTIDSVDINNIKANVLVHGDLWWYPSTQLAGCEFPKGSGKNISFAGSLWMAVMMVGPACTLPHKPTGKQVMTIGPARWMALVVYLTAHRKHGPKYGR